MSIANGSMTKVEWLIYFYFIQLVLVAYWVKKTLFENVIFYNKKVIIIVYSQIKNNSFYRKIWKSVFIKKYV